MGDLLIGNVSILGAISIVWYGAFSSIDAVAGLCLAIPAKEAAAMAPFRPL